MFATFCVYFVYDFYTTNNNNNKNASLFCQKQAVKNQANKKQR